MKVDKKTSNLKDGGGEGGRKIKVTKSQHLRSFKAGGLLGQGLLVMPRLTRIHGETFIFFQIFYVYDCPVFIYTRRGNKIPSQMVVSPHVVAGN